MPLTSSEKERYSRHLLIPEIGIEGQQQLKNASVLVVGCGGLGSPALLYLAAAGIGTIGLVDNDLVDKSNLQRQVLFGADSIGKSKVEEAKKRLQNLNSDVVYKTYQTQLNASNALDILADYDVVLDGSDNFPTRYLVNDACVILGKPLVYGAIYRFEGQVAVFNYKGGINYRHLFPTPPSAELAPNCAEAGVLGVLPGIIGCVQATEVLKIITNFAEPLDGKLWVFDSRSMASRVIRIPKIADSPKITELIDYEDFCGLKTETTIKKIDYQTLQKWQVDNKDFVLIDVREPHEYERANLGGLLRPLSQIEVWKNTLDPTKTTVIHCQSGKRSLQAIQKLMSLKNFDNIYNLSGGLLGNNI